MAIAISILMFVRPSEPSHQGKPLNEWLASFSHSRVGDYYSDEQVTAMRQMGKEAIPFVRSELSLPISNAKNRTPAVVRHIQFLLGIKPKPDPRQRVINGLRAVTALGTNALPLAPELVRLLNRPEDTGAPNPGSVNRYAAVALAGLGAPGVTPLTNALASTNAEVSRAAAEVVLELGAKDYATGGPKKVYSFMPPDSRERFNAQTNAYLPTLIRALEDLQPSANPNMYFRGTRTAAITVIQRLMPDPAQVLPTLVRNLKHPDASERSAAASVLGAYEGKAALAVPALTGLLEDADPKVRLAAAYALSAIDPNAARAALPVLESAAGSQPGGYFDSQALGKLGPAAVPALVKALGRTNQSDRKAAAWQLSRFGAASAPAIPALIGLLEDESDEVREAAARALGEINSQPELVVPALAKLLKDELPNVISTAAGALEQFGPRAKSALPALEKAAREAPENYKSPDGKRSQYNPSRYAAKRAIQEIRKPVASTSQPATTTSMQRDISNLSPATQPNWRSRLETARNLSHEHSRFKAQPAVPALLRALKDPSEDVRQAAAATLRIVAPEQQLPEVQPPLADSDADRMTNSAARFALEFEKLPVVEMLAVSPGGQVGISSNKWSAGSYALYYKSYGDMHPSITFQFAVAKDGRYTLNLYAARAPDLGNYNVYLNGRPLGQRLDGYAAREVATGAMPLGAHELAQGAHTISFVLSDKRDSAAYLKLGLDCLEVIGQRATARDSALTVAPGAASVEEAAKLAAAAADGKIEVVKAWLKRHPSHVNARDSLFSTPLHAAALHNRIEVAAFLLAEGADVNARDAKRQTPLHHAWGNSKLKLLELLLAHGADASAEDYNGWTPSVWADNGRQYEAAALLRQARKAGSRGQTGSTVTQGLALSGSGRSISSAAASGNLTLLRQILDAHPDAIRPTNAWSPLYTAAYNGRYDAVEFLLERGAATNSHGGGVDSALLGAVERGHLQIVELLLANGANPNQKGQMARTLVEIAQAKGHTGVAELLRKHGAKE